jgi:TRAP transporter 4TM/12TM fusion protein
MPERLRRLCEAVLAVALATFTVFEVNLARMTPLAGLAVFALFGLVFCYLRFPLLPRWGDVRWLRVIDVGLAALSAACCIYLVAQGKDLGQRAGAYTAMDIAVGVVGLALVVEATRRSIGLALPLISVAFFLYALFGPSLPDWMFPHRGYAVDRVVAQTFLRTEGVFGTALRVMFTYVFLFVLFGAFLEATGATQFIIDLSGRLFSRSPGGPAKVAVLSSGLLGSLSGSAVANAVTSGTFTIPMMRSSGFERHIAGGVEASASSGGALVPPVMGAGAYMMLEIIDPPVTYLQIIRAALIPAILYYLSLFLFVHFYAAKIGSKPKAEEGAPRPLGVPEGLVFVGSLAALLFFLLWGYSAFRAVTYGLGVLVALSSFHPRTRLGPRSLLLAFMRSAESGVPLIAASACVGIVIGVVTLTGVGTAFPNAILPLAERSLFFALLALMGCSIVLGMGLPSAVCYLLLATLIGPVLGRLGVVPMAAHFFIFYFGLMSMVTPPVALAAYATASIAGASIMRTGLAAFRFSLVGFTLPYMFVYRPQLLFLADDGSTAAALDIAAATLVGALGVSALAVGLAGYLFTSVTGRDAGGLFRGGGDSCSIQGGTCWAPSACSTSSASGCSSRSPPPIWPPRDGPRQCPPRPDITATWRDPANDFTIP